ncbi:MAG: copper chaperone PCu(A)C [Steroidobacterales bacterium]
MHYSRRLLAAGLLSAIGWAAGAPGAQPLPAVQARDAWVRWLPGNLPAGGYVTLVNTSDQPVRLVAASCPDYGVVSLHRSLNVGDTARMQPVEQITIAAHSSLQFAAQGYHLMLERPQKALQPGDRVLITLSFADAAALTVPFELRRPDASAEMPGMPDMPGMAH